ncbi:MAG: DUF507 family protein [Nitrospirae bacterium]|nr:DUF507 family protein [Nitrospirota bacterium]
MLLSDDKISHLSHIILSGLKTKGLISLKIDEGKIRKEIKRIIANQLKVGDDIDNIVRRKLTSLSRKVVEGSSEWDILYNKYYAEEENKRGRH